LEEGKSLVEQTCSGCRACLHRCNTGRAPLALGYVNIVGAAFSAVAAIATGLLAINGWRENFIRYGCIYHMIQVEKYLYLEQATKEYFDDDPKKMRQELCQTY
jgi:hypothetical protein